MSHEDTYELERQRIIKENLALLESLGLGGNSINNNNTLKPRHSSSSTSKRPALAKRTSSRSSTRLKRESTIAGAESSLRRSARNVGRDQKTPGTRPVVRHQRRLSDFIVDDDEDDSHLKQRTGEGLGKGVALARLHNPKQFGSIPNVPVGKAWPLRAGASMDSIHAPLVACISGNPTVGAWSVCFSGGYEDNIDLGESFVLTGAGGRDLKGNGKNLRTAEQSFDQSFEHAMNGALKRSSETGKPVRVVRGYKTDCEWAPLEGESTGLPVLSFVSTAIETLLTLSLSCSRLLVLIIRLPLRRTL
jgi:E3 ubiquitin-protein ligase UHRF1